MRGPELAHARSLRRQEAWPRSAASVAKRRTATHRASSQPMAIPLMSHADAAVGNAIEAAVTLKHRRRLRRLGWERALEPPDDGLWAAGDPPPREGCSLDVLVDGAQALPAIAEAIAGRARLRARHRLAPRAALRARPRRAADRHRRAARRAGRAHRRARARVGRRAGAGLPPDALGGAGGRRARSRAARASAASSTRASTRSTATTRRRSCIDGELAFVGGIDLTDDGRRPLRLQRAPGPAAPGLARRRHAPARARGGRRARSLRRRAGTRSTGERLERPAPARAGGRQHGAGRAHRGRGHVRRRSRAATSGSSRATCARCAARSA